MSLKRFLYVILLLLLAFLIAFALVRFRPAQPPPSPTPTPAGAVTLPRLLVASVPPEIPAYRRDDWRHWVDADGDCQDTRQEVLIAESLQPIVFTDARACSAASGLWLSPYDALRLTSPQDLDVDHMVPLANAHRSGGWRWDPARKQAFANSLDYPGHLIAVAAATNRAKGDKGPEEWRPPDHDAWCQYAIDWVSIKAAWDLTATHTEWTALQDMLGACGFPVRIGDDAIPTSTIAASPTPRAPGGLLFDPAGPDRDCADFPAWQAAQDFYRTAGGPQHDPHRLDPDRDGLACEALPGAPQ